MNQTKTAVHTDDGFKVVVEHRFTDEAVRNLLVSAFEGGSNSWYMIERHDYGTVGEAAFQEGGTHFDPEYRRMDHYLLPFVAGCAVIITDNSGEAEDSKKEYRLDRAALQNGLEVMREKFQHHWRDFVAENSDAITADVFLQCCLFGDVVYG